MISACDNILSTNYRNCNQIYSDNDIPVYDENRLLYRNLACGKCHRENGHFTEIDILVSNCQDMKPRMEKSVFDTLSLENYDNCFFSIKKGTYAPYGERGKYFDKDLSQNPVQDLSLIHI